MPEPSTTWSTSPTSGIPEMPAKPIKSKSVPALQSSHRPMSRKPIVVLAKRYKRSSGSSSMSTEKQTGSETTAAKLQPPQPLHVQGKCVSYFLYSVQMYNLYYAKMLRRYSVNITYFKTHKEYM